MKEAVNVNMIVLARESRGFNQSELAERIEMLPTYLSKIERGDVNASNEMLVKVAATTRYPISFFYQTGTIVPVD
jgi:transcriptional regulator with XRE-family HTH domain